LSTNKYLILGIEIYLLSNENGDEAKLYIHWIGYMNGDMDNFFYMYFFVFNVIFLPYIYSYYIKKQYFIIKYVVKFKLLI